MQLKEAEVGNLQPNSIESAQLQMLRASSGKEAIVLNNFSQSLTELISTVEIQKQQGTEALGQAEGLRNRIILGSMLISALIAVALADKTSRAIAQPLQTVTNVAQQIDRESNFNLQLPVTTQDEIGVLASDTEDTAGRCPYSN